MAGPLVFWPNRKSGLGMRVLSRASRSLRRPFSTTPPVAKDEDMNKEWFGPTELHEHKRLDEIIKREHRLTAKAREVLGATDPALLEMFDRLDKARNSRGDDLDRAKADLEIVSAELSKVRIDLSALMPQVRAAETENARLRENEDRMVADLRRLQKEVDPDEIKLRIMYAVDEALEKANAEKAALRQQLSAAESEIAELKRSKKRLREALDRLAKQT